MARPSHVRRVILCIFGLMVSAALIQAADTDAPRGEWVADVAHKVLPSVVNISSTKTILVQRSPLFSDPLFREFFGGRIPQERVQRSLGSGVIVSPDGYIITNNHVVGGADRVEVRLADDQVLMARIIGADPKSDVAVIKIEAQDLPALAVGDSSTLRIGTLVLAVGNPFGLEQTVTMGIVSALGRSGLGITDYENFIQTDAAINPGNSGGALVNLRGELIGINTAIFSGSGGSVGIGFAIPVNLAMHIKDSFLRYGKVVRGWLGVTVQDLSPEIAQAMMLKSTRGVLISGIVPGSPAATAGLQRGDIIVSLNRQEVNNASALRYHTAELTPGSRVAAGIIRERRALTLMVDIGDLSESRPQEETFTISDNRFLAGATVGELSPAIREHLRLGTDLEGVVILEVERGSPAEATGIRPGDVILELNRSAIRSLAELREVLGDLSGRRLKLSIYRNGSVMSLTIMG